MVEYSAFNRFVPGSNPGQSINKIKKRRILHRTLQGGRMTAAEIISIAL